MSLQKTIDGILTKAITDQNGKSGAPGVVAIAANQNEIIYEGARGVRSLDSLEPMTTDTVLALMSCSKAITATVVMQLVEEGRLKLDDVAKDYVAELEDLKVLQGFDSDGTPRLRNPKGDITVKHLLLHTSGLGYDFFNADLIAYGKGADVPSVTTGTMASIRSVLLFDPGSKWEYGTSIDWVGKVVEEICQKPLGEVLRRRVLDPLGMNATGYKLMPAMESRRATVHQRGADGRMATLPNFLLPQDPEQHMGGHFLYGPATDYIKFIQMILNDGEGPFGRILEKDTVELMTTNQLGDLKLVPLPGAIPSLTNDAEFFPGMPKSWGLSWMINDLDAPTGRPAGAVGWAGLCNTYYWIDRKTGVGGFWGSQILPLIDEASTAGYLDFETAVYSALGASSDAFPSVNGA